MGKGARNRKAHALEMENYKKSGAPKLIRREAEKQLKDLNEQFYKIEMSVILYVLWDTFDPNDPYEFLMKYVKNYRPAINELAEYYGGSDPDMNYFCSKKLKEIGIDIDNMPMKDTPESDRHRWVTVQKEMDEKRQREFEARNQIEWKQNPGKRNSYYCPVCSQRMSFKSNFCPNCGSMRKGAKFETIYRQSIPVQQAGNDEH